MDPDVVVGECRVVDRRGGGGHMARQAVVGRVHRAGGAVSSFGKHGATGGKRRSGRNCGVAREALPRNGRVRSLRYGVGHGM